MANNVYTHIISGGSFTVSLSPGVILSLIVINTGFTGTITISDGALVVGIITNPVTGQFYPYDITLNTSLIVNPSAACDLTVCWH